MIICVDFDGTLCKHKFPAIGKADKELIQKLINHRKNGDKLILWTCRDGKVLDEAVEWCKKLGLEFDTINDDLQEIKDSFIYKSQKVYGDIYIDDRNKLIETFKGEHKW